MDKSDQMEYTSFTKVECSGMVFMKIVKHCHDDYNTMNVAQGGLLGLVVNDCLEVTNCFPYQRMGQESMDDHQYQLTMMRHLRRLNVDHAQVGWYQATIAGSFFSLEVLESQYQYQNSVPESIVFAYDPQKSLEGFSGLKAYRLTQQALETYADGKFEPNVLRDMNVGYETLFTEIPIVIKNSLLANILMTQLLDELPPQQGHKQLDLNTTSSLELHLSNLITRLDELYQDSSKYGKYQQALAKQEAEKQRVLAKEAAANEVRAKKGEPEISNKEILKQFIPLQPPERLNATMASGHINTSAMRLIELCSNALAKLLITQTAQQAKEEDETKKEM